MRRSFFTALGIPALLASLVILVGCKSQPQAAEASSTTATQTQPAAPAPAATSSLPANTDAETAPAKETPAAAPVATPAQTAAPAPASSVAGLPDVDPHKTRGSKSAPIVMETFSDFQCPACKQLYMTTTRQLNDNYVTSGRVYLIHRDFPLAGHAYSRIAARYGRAAAAIGKFEQAEQVLFQNQEKWEQTGDVDGTVASAFSPADMTKIRAMIKTPAVDTAIEKDVALGKTYSVSQTPTIVIHYKGQTYPIGGYVAYDALHTFLDQLLSSK